MNQTQTAASIFAGFVLVASSILLTFPVSNSPVSVEASTSVGRTAEARIYGDIDAPTRIVEFSDLECPFCARLHPTLKTIVDESNGQIAWEYRHLPLPNHVNALPAAIISECVARKSGNASYFAYLDDVFASYEGLNRDKLVVLAERHGLTAEEVTACESNQQIINLIETDQQVAASFGGRGTPFSIIIFPDGTTKPVSGALPLLNWQRLLQ